jgi:polyvinyl alcohol dehydrogenase (cytochrome)
MLLRYGLPIVCAAVLASCEREPPPAQPSETAPAAAAAVHPGAAVYEQHCGNCHTGGVYKAPHRMFLGMMAPDAILESMDGIMAAQAAALTEQQRRAVAEYLAGRSLDSERIEYPPLRCAQADLKLQQMSRHASWGIDLRNTRFQAAEHGGLDAGNAASLKLQWAFAYPNAIQARSQPTVAGGTVFVGSQNGTVYALDAKTGCLRWTYRASAEVRTPVVLSPWDIEDVDAQPHAYFGDILARAYALDARTGKLLWQTKVDDHPNATITGAPVLFEDWLFVPVSSLEVVSAVDPGYACCTFRGSLVALDAADGSMRWKTYTIENEASDAGVTSAGTQILAPSGAPIWNSPTVDIKRRRLYAGTGENYSSPAGGTSDAVIAFAMDTGDILWINQATAGDAWNVGCLSDYAPDPANCPVENGPDFDFAASVILQTLPDGSDLLVAGQKSGDVIGIDPDTGATRWRTKVGRGGVQGGIHFGMAAEGSRIYVPISDMVYPEDVTRYKFESPPRPGIFAVDAATGTEIWARPADDVCPAGNPFCDPGISAAVTAIPDAVIAGHMDGWLRIYAAVDGAVLWEYDTLKDQFTVSGETARGGSMSGGGPAVADGMLYVNSGYGIYFHMPGNMLLAFGPKSQ